MQTCAEFWQFMIGLQAIAWLEWAKAVFDLLKGVAWPLAVFGVIWIFRDPIRARIPFIKEVGPRGAVFLDGQQPSFPVGGSPLQTADHPLRTVNTLAAVIQDDLLSFVPEQREPRLIRALAEARVLADFEFIFASIFQSQIDALEELTSGAIALPEAEKMFEERVRPAHRELYAEVDFEKWSAYLRSQGLVSVDDGKATITEKGADFLNFVKRAKVGFAKSG